MRVSIPIFATVACAAVLAACGGGPAGTSPPAPTLTPSLAPSGAAATAQWSGAVTADAPGTPGIAGALVRLGTTFAGGTIGAVVASATTAPDGSFAFVVPLATALAPAAPPAVATLPPDVAIPPGFGPAYPQPPPLPPGTTAMLTVQIDATGFAPLHRLAYLQPGSVRQPAYRIAALNGDDLAALAQLNADRAVYGSGAGRNPLGFDSDLERAGRFASATMAALGFYAHDYPGTASFVSFTYWCAIDALCGRYPAIPAFGENQDASIGARGSLESAEAAYIAEGPAGSHFRAVVAASAVWVGFGEAFAGTCDPALAAPAGVSCSYFTEEFAAAP